jgi:hypothetical protein
MRHLAHFFAQIHCDRSIDPERVQEDDTWSLLADTAAEAEHHYALELRHDADRANEDAHADDEHGEKKTADE